jgi:UDP-GlcNAc:undecaprenyl-phosphate GlcNAc-1-phosphate transferase
MFEQAHAISMNEISLSGSSVLGDLLKYPLILLLGIILSWLFTPIAIKLARRTGMLDRPDSRRLHTVATPRSGGLALFLSAQICFATSLYFPWGDEIRGSLTKEWWSIHLLSSSILLVVGVLDDLFQISWFLKLAGQVVACSIAFFLGLHFNFLGTFELAAGWDYLLTMLWFLGIINAFNLIDGMDGLAAGLAAVASIGLAMAAVFQRAPLDTLIWISLAASCIGFLRYNFHPAQVFLGDAGSMFLGFTIASITLQTSTKSTAIASIGLPLLAVGVPVFDTMLALWRRSVRSIATRKAESWLTKLASPDKEHLHHRLLGMGLTQRKVAVLLYMTSIGLVGIGLLSLVFREQSGAIFIVAILLGSYVALKHIAATELWDSGAALVRGLRKPSTPVVTMTLYPAIDLCFLLSGLLFASLLLEDSSSIAQAKIDFLSRVRDLVRSSIFSINCQCYIPACMESSKNL